MQHTPLEKLDKKLFVKGSCASEPNGGAVNSKEVVNSKEIALMETKMNKLCDLLDEVSFGAVIQFLFHPLDQYRIEILFFGYLPAFLYVLIMCIWILAACALNNSYFFLW